MPPGSASKVKRLLAGRIPFSSQSEWPDGRSAHETVGVYALELPAEVGDEELAELNPGLVSSLEADEPLHEISHQFPERPSFVLTGDEKFAIETALEVSVEKYKIGVEDLSSLTELGLSVEALDQGVCLWFNANQPLADELLLVWSDFENVVCSFIAALRPPSFPWS